MLQKIGDTFTNQRWLAYIIFGALSVIFAAWGAYGIATLNFSSGNNAAKVNGVTIPYAEIRDAWMERQAQWERQFGGNMPQAVKAQLENQLLEQYIRDTLLAERTRKLGYRIGQRQLEEAIRQQPAFQLQGKYSAAVAEMRLQQAGISQQSYEADLRQSLRVGQLNSGIADSAFLTPAEVKRIEALESEERNAQYLVLPASRYASSKPIPPAAVKAYYKAHQAQFMTPEYVTVRYAELHLSQVLAKTQVTDEALASYYKKHKSEFVVPARRRARHILIAINAHRTAAEALARADKVLAKLKAGVSFTKLAKTYSDDSGSANQGGDLGWTERSAFTGPMAAFGKVLFAMQKVGAIKGPVRTQYGYHIIQLEGIQPGKTKTLAEVRSQIKPIVQRRAANQRFGNIHEAIQEQLDEGSPSLEGLAKTYHMKLGEVAKFIRGQGGAPLGDSHQLEQTVYSRSVLDEHHLGGPVALGNNRIVLVSDIAHHLPHPKPLAEVRATIVAALQKARRNDAALAAAHAAVKRLEAGASFAAVAKRLGVEAAAPRFVGRNDPSVPTAIRNEIFNSPKPEAHRPVYRAFALKSGGAALVAVTQVKSNVLPNPQRMQSTLTRLARASGQDAAQDYVDQARLKAKVKKNLQVFD